MLGKWSMRRNSEPWIRDLQITRKKWGLTHSLPCLTGLQVMNQICKVPHKLLPPGSIRLLISNLTQILSQRLLNGQETRNKIVRKLSTNLCMIIPMIDLDSHLRLTTKMSMGIDKAHKNPSQTNGIETNKNCHSKHYQGLHIHHKCRKPMISLFLRTRRGHRSQNLSMRSTARKTMIT